MLNRHSTISFAVTMLLTSVAPAAMAQNFQNWMTNEANQIQQNGSSGMLAPGQLSNLQNREAQIQAQQQQFLNQNGGVMTPGESSRIGSELKRLNRSLSKDLSSNGVYNNGAYNNGIYSNGMYNNGAPAPSLGYNGGGFWHHLFGGGSNYQAPMGTPYTGTPYVNMPYSGTPYGGTPSTAYNGYPGNTWQNSNGGWNRQYNNFNNNATPGFPGTNINNNGLNSFAHHWYNGNSNPGLLGTNTINNGLGSIAHNWNNGNSNPGLLGTNTINNGLGSIAHNWNNGNSNPGLLGTNTINNGLGSIAHHWYSGSASSGLLGANGNHNSWGGHDGSHRHS